MSSLNSLTSRSSTASSEQSVPLSQSLSLQGGYYQGFEIDSFANNTYVEYASVSVAPISLALMNSSQYNDFENIPSDPISNSLIHNNGTSIENSDTIAKGQYFLVFYSDYNTNIQYGFEVFPNTPFSYGPASYPLASGIASFGIYNNSGVVTPYEIRTNRIVGLANISSFQADTANASKYGDDVTGATLQLNTMLVVQDSGASPQKDYWVQEVPDFTTGTSQVSFGDEIWNFTDLAGFLSNQTITSINFLNGGFVYPGGNGTTPVYNYNSNNITYQLPLDFGLIINDTVLPKTGVLIQLGYRLIASGQTISPSITNWFDNVTIHDTNVEDSYFDVAGNSTTPVGDFFDTELVFAGEGNLESAYFPQLSAQLGLFYQNGTGTLSSFPTYYDFSGDTGEAADNLVVSYADGIVRVGTGANPNYVYLGNASLTLNPDLTVRGGLGNLNFTTITAGSSATASTTSNSNSVSSSALIAVAIVAVIVVVLIVAVAASRRRRPQQTYPQVFSPSMPMNQSFCTNCGAFLLPGSRFCGNCGNPTRSSNESYT